MTLGDTRKGDDDSPRRISTADLRAEDVPTYEGWERFARTFNGYDAVGDARCAEIANRKSPRTLEEYRICLFFEHRRCHFLQQEPDPETKHYIESLLEGIREHIRVRGRTADPGAMDLFSSVLSQRLAASLALPPQGVWPDKFGPQPCWPWGNHGAGNAFAVLVGPSPGGAPTDGLIHEHAATLGPFSGFHGFNHNPQRNLTWLPLAEASFGVGGDTAAHRALGALFNFSGENQSDASKLILTDRDADECVARLETTRPIIVVALMGDVFNRLLAAWSRAGARLAPFSGPVNRQRKLPVPLAASVVEWSWRKEAVTRTLLVRAPRHPAHPDKLASGVNSKTPEGVVLRWEVLRETVQQFLDGEARAGHGDR